MWAPVFTIPGEHGKTVWQAPTSAISEEANATARVHLTFNSNINSVMGAYNYLVPDGVGNKTSSTHTHTHSLSLTYKAIPLTYKRGCALS